MTLGQVFNGGNNALNAWRLVLAAEVMLWHCWPVTGRMPPAATLQLLFSIGVDGFFAISGFLITRSWLDDPHVRDYLTARALRILPGYYACLIVTAFAFAPLSVALQGGSVGELVCSGGPLEYVLKNSAVAYVHLDVGGTPSGIPHSGLWNGSLWSLVWEVICYLAVAGVGLAGLAHHRWVSPAILVVATGLATAMPPMTFPGVWTIPQIAVRSAIMFAAGAVLYQWREVIPARWPLVGVSVVIVLASSMLPDYRTVAALPLAYAIIVSGALLKSSRLRLRTDLSYGVYIYAFPTQQLLAVCGLARLQPVAFFLVAAAATLPVAAASWFLIEKPSMALKRRLKRKWSDATKAEGGHPATTTAG
ncbi:acyltransferase [Mycobacterium intracellulare]|uniref:acyltransferase family protein n=1 Tax=Mycobacterium intracellulare TaxID=1767 RepID=UPI001CDA13A4|nr:acyltransferase [Mycobacterium intracellulare]MCA2255029.1 acyltransferase [Mycobacterium intracellulare]MCA2305392.1 acyltransferase [Mycobacterium intracellulare]MCA2348068.1 acyltransferase [Mycobacterium intracellulare]UGU04630.1 acyltransferase [Mycobacterium intracellulare]